MQGLEVAIINSTYRNDSGNIKHYEINKICIIK